MPRRHAVLALVVAICWAVNFVVIDIGLESFPPLLFAALRFGLIAFPAVFFVPRPDVRWLAVVAVGALVAGDRIPDKPPAATEAKAPSGGPMPEVA